MQKKTDGLCALDSVALDLALFVPSPITALALLSWSLTAQ